MAKIVSIISLFGADSLMFTLDFAKVIELLDLEACIVQDAPYQALLFNYQFNLLEMSGVSFYDTLDQVQAEQIVLYNGYHQAADHYIVVVNHDMFAIKSLSAYLETLNIDTAQFVLLNALDVKQDTDYVYNMYFERFVDCANKLFIAFDEREQERLFNCQLEQAMTLKNIGRQRLEAYHGLLADIIDGEVKTVRQLKQLIKRG